MYIACIFLLWAGTVFPGIPPSSVGWLVEGRGCGDELLWCVYLCFFLVWGVVLIPISDISSDADQFRWNLERFLKATAAPRQQLSAASVVSS